MDKLETVLLKDIQHGTFFISNKKKYLYVFVDPDLNDILDGTEYVWVLDYAECHVTKMHIHEEVIRIKEDKQTGYQTALEMLKSGIPISKMKKG